MQLNIYYLDDEKELCENFEDYFASDKINVKTFTDPERLIECFKLTPPDVLFVDYRLPGTTGDEVAMRLDPKIPKYLITGEIIVGTSYKFAKVFAKPFRVNDIAMLLEQLLSRKKVA